MNPDTPPITVKNPLSVMQPGEQMICEIKRHPIGLIGIYLAATFAIVIALVVIFVLVPQFVTGDNKTKVTDWLTVLFMFGLGLAALMVLIANIVYKSNRWIVTSDSITQVARSGLFSTQSSQLSMGNLEDITAQQNGIMAHMFNYGVLRAETAGERLKFFFIYCPNPNYYAQQILGARERFEQTRRGQDEQSTYRAEGSYAQPAPPATSAPYEPPTNPQPPTA